MGVPFSETNIIMIYNCKKKTTTGLKIPPRQDRDLGLHIEMGTVTVCYEGGRGRDGERLLSKLYPTLKMLTKEAVTTEAGSLS